MRFVLSVVVGTLALGVAVADVPGVCSFKLLASRRYVLDNELTLAELSPEAVSVASLQHPLIWGEGNPSVAFAGDRLELSAPKGVASGAVLVSGWLPGAHYSADCESLSATEWLTVKPTAFPDSLADLKTSFDYLKGVLS